MKVLLVDKRIPNHSKYVNPKWVWAEYTTRLISATALIIINGDEHTLLPTPPGITADEIQKQVDEIFGIER